MVCKNIIHMLLLLGISCTSIELKSYFFRKPTIQSIKKAWRHTLMLQRTRKKLSREKLEKNTIFTKKNVEAYKTSLVSFEYEKKMAYIIYYIEKSLQARICMLYCQPSRRGSGLASYLMLKCIDHLKKMRVKSVSLYACPFENVIDPRELEKLISFYQKFGFEAIDRKFTGVTMKLDIAKKEV